ncbi:MAG: FKBP-type peptidyl-prolyl cis-trans isomerase [Planctomycetota bacterium]
MHRCLSMIAVVCLLTSMSYGQEDADSKAKLAKEYPVGYFLGVSMGQQLGNQGLTGKDINADAIAAGVRDALKGKLVMSDAELQAAQKKLQDLIDARFKSFLDEKTKVATAWLTANKKKDGVKELDGGLQYKVVTAGKGGSPTQSDRVKVHYTGKLTNGEIFDSSVKRGQPASFMVGGVIKGWQMALQKMKVGDKWMLYIPPNLAYGERGSPPAIGPNEVLVFEVELLEIL